MTATQDSSPNPIKFWASITNSDGSVRFLCRHNHKLCCEEIFHPIKNQWTRYEGDSLEDVLEGRYPMLTREQAAELFPHIADRLDE